MKTIPVPPRSKTLQALLKRARHAGLILQCADGQRFVLASIQDWQGFDVGPSDDFAHEVERTVRNKSLMKTLAERRGHGKRIPLARAKAQLGFDDQSSPSSQR